MKKVELLDVCYPDYFTGYHKPVLAVYLTSYMTHSELAEEMKQEINAAWDYLCNEDGGYTEEEMKLFDEYINELMDENVKDELFTKELYESEEDAEGGCYAYFAICEITYSNGMKFLNP